MNGSLIATLHIYAIGILAVILVASYDHRVARDTQTMKVVAAVVDNGCTGANQLQFTAKPQSNQTTYDINKGFSNE
jgi:hypothetical protein